MKPLPPELTPQEKKILALMGEGTSRNVSIGKQLNISPHTAKNHKENLKAEFGLTTYEELMKLAVELKIQIK